MHHQIKVVQSTAIICGIHGCPSSDAVGDMLCWVNNVRAKLVDERKDAGAAAAVCRWDDRNREWDENAAVLRMPRKNGSRLRRTVVATIIVQLCFCESRGVERGGEEEVWRRWWWGRRKRWEMREDEGILSHRVWRLAQVLTPCGKSA